MSAIVVNIQNIRTGEMEPETLEGFVAVARHLGIPVIDEQRFLRDEQHAVFAWAEKGSRFQNKPS